MPLFKMVNGERIQMSPEEEAELEASRARSRAAAATVDHVKEQILGDSHSAFLCEEIASLTGETPRAVAERMYERVFGPIPPRPRS